MKLTGENRFYVYVYLDPRKPGDFNYYDVHFDYEPFYVGKGCNYRISQHLGYELSPSRSKVNTYKTGKINHILNEGLKPISTIIKSAITESEAFKIEKKYIASIGRKGVGPLTNLTDGGEESAGRIVSNETREKIREILTGKQHTDVTKEKMKIRMTGSGNPGYGKIGELNVRFGKVHTLESIEKMKKPKTEKTRQKMREAKNKESKLRVNIEGKINVKNVTFAEASRLTEVRYANIHHCLSVRNNDKYFKNDFIFIKIISNI